ncbi:MAG: tetratricopeptide repeat protein [Myxococcales bacterium]|nr:tetratricopeptide repeat protein [Myxococcales bacterium]
MSAGGPRRRASIFRPSNAPFPRVVPYRACGSRTSKIHLVLFVLGASAWVDPAWAQTDPSRDRERDAARLLEMGRRMLDAGEVASATAFFRDAIDVRPDLAEAYEGLARALLARGAERDARTTVEAGLGRNPGHVPLMRLMATLLDRRGQLAEAARWLREVVARVPDDIEAQRARLDLALRRGAFAEALDACRAVRLHLRDESRREQSRQCAALEVLLDTTDPVRSRRQCRPEASAVRRALAGCRATAT